MNFHFSQKTIGIVGFGVEGKSTHAFLKKHRAKHILIFDEKVQDEWNVFDESKKQDALGIFRVSFGNLPFYDLKDATGNSIRYTKGNRKYGFNHFRKHLSSYVAGYISHQELICYLPMVLAEGVHQAHRDYTFEEYTTEVFEKEIQGVVFQAVVAKRGDEKYVVSFFSDRYFTVYKKAREGLHLDQPNSRYTSETIITYREEKYQAEKNNPHIHSLSELPVNTIFNVFPFLFLDSCDLLFRSPGVHPEKITKHLPNTWKGTLTSATQFFFDHAPTHNIIGVTGTKGKGTTSTLLTHMLQKSGFSVFLGGNIGTPIFDFFDELTAESVVVLELSSFQLYDTTKSPPFAVLLRTDTEHLDWHSDVNDYRNAKKNMFRFQDRANVLVYFGNSSIVSQMREESIAQKISVLAEEQNKSLQWIDADVSGNIVMNGIKTGINTSDIALRGSFHHENVLAAVAMAKQFAVSDATIKTVLQSFSGLPMRMEKICEKNGRSYYNDSFSTIPETTISALSTFQTPVYLIVGGSEKYSDFTQLASVCAKTSYLHKIYLIGITAHRIAEALEKAGFLQFEFASDLQSIVQDFQTISQKGDSLVLSPGCASFGMFKNYKERGEIFVEEVKKNDILSVKNNTFI